MAVKLARHYSVEFGTDFSTCPSLVQSLYMTILSFFQLDIRVMHDCGRVLEYHALDYLAQYNSLVYGKKNRD